MEPKEFCLDLSVVLRRTPQAMAVVRGIEMYPEIYGEVRFYQMEAGVLVAAEIEGLPVESAPCDNPVFGFHIHEGGKCSGNSEDMLADTGGHFNPNNCLHPYHAGDMPPLFGANGYAFTAFFSNRFKVSDVIGRTVVIHAKPDDFMTQPSGASGEKIACGVID